MVVVDRVDSARGTGKHDPNRELEHGRSANRHFPPEMNASDGSTFFAYSASTREKSLTE